MQNSQFDESANIKLILEDVKMQITFNVNKKYLSMCGLYFQNILTKFKENFINRIKIIVPNALISYDVIMSLFGEKTNIGNIPEYQHILETIICHDFFCLDIDYNSLNDIVLPFDDLNTFNLLIKTLNIINKVDEYIDLIFTYIPKNYNFNESCCDFFNIFTKFSQTKYLVIGNRGDYSIIAIFDLNKKIIQRVKLGKISSCVFLSNNKILVHSIVKNPCINKFRWLSRENYDIYNINNLKHSFFDKNKCIEFTRHDAYLKYNINNFYRMIHMIQMHGNKIRIYDAGGTLIKKLYKNNINICNYEIDWNKIKPSEIIISHDQKYLIFISPFDGNKIIYQKIIIVDVQNEKILLEIDNPHELEISEIRVSNNNNFVISSSECEIKSWNLISGKLEKNYFGHKNLITHIDISSDNKFLLSADNKNVVKLWNITTGRLIMVRDIQQECGIEEISELRFLNNN
ncbi:BTB/POZ domain-containing protein,ankyrin repeat protein [Megavirus baoshan]|uniref:Putative BTB/POZ domain-containing protein n=1 Tax=Megavirus baoshan TaxID=2496520 RepID=A0A3Q8U7S7_9VIRU|nr:BTB/POZ domain-containing protein,ankyrin repeat protein [Megavirus baoshan]AZL89300.1 BTB/POZ domain-containing protein,ankyrin repeat protein [Megavirus baoshan]